MQIILMIAFIFNMLGQYRCANLDDQVIEMTVSGAYGSMKWYYIDLKPLVSVPNLPFREIQLHDRARNAEMFASYNELPNIHSNNSNCIHNRTLCYWTYREGRIYIVIYAKYGSYHEAKLKYSLTTAHSEKKKDQPISRSKSQHRAIYVIVFVNVFLIIWLKILCDNRGGAYPIVFHDKRHVGGS